MDKIFQSNALTANVSNMINSSNNVAQERVREERGDSTLSNIAKTAGNYFNKHSNSLAEAEYNEAMQDAQLELTKRVQERESVNYDQDGKANYGKLVDDVVGISKDIENKYISKVGSTVRSNFKNNFGNLATNATNRAFGVARKKEIAYLQSNLQNTLNRSTERALEDDPKNKGIHINNISNALANSVKAGLMNKEQAQSEMLKARNNINTNVMANQISSAPKSMLDLLSNSKSSELGITHDNRLSLIRLAKAGVKDEKDMIKKQDSMKEEELKRNQNANFRNMEVIVKKTSESVSEKDIWEAHLKGQITIDKRNSLISSLDSTKAREKRKVEEAIVIQEKIANSDNIFLDDRQQKLDWEASTDGLDPNDPLFMRQLTQVAVSKPYAVKPMAKMLGNALATAPLSKSQQVLESYQTLYNTEGNYTLSALGSKELEIGALATTLNSLGVSPQESLKEARETYNNQDPTVLQQRTSEYLSNFKDNFDIENLNEFIVDNFTDSPIANFFGMGEEVTPETSRKLQQVLKSAFLKTGSKESAYKVLKSRMDGIFGVQKLDGIDYVMEYPPNKELNMPDFEEQFGLFKETITESLPEDMQDRPFRVQADALTHFLISEGKGMVSYPVMYRDGNGNSVPVTDNEGNTFRYPLYEIDED